MEKKREKGLLEMLIIFHMVSFCFWHDFWVSEPLISGVSCERGVKNQGCRTLGKVLRFGSKSVPNACLKAVKIIKMCLSGRPEACVFFRLFFYEKVDHFGVQNGTPNGLEKGIKNTSFSGPPFWGHFGRSGCRFTR